MEFIWRDPHNWSILLMQLHDLECVLPTEPDIIIGFITRISQIQLSSQIGGAA